MKDQNALQSLSIIGIIFSIIVHIILIIIDKQIERIWALYPTWIFVYFIGFLFKKYGAEEDHHH